IAGLASFRRSLGAHLTFPSASHRYSAARILALWSCRHCKGRLEHRSCRQLLEEGSCVIAFSRPSLQVWCLALRTLLLRSSRRQLRRPLHTAVLASSSIRRKRRPRLLRRRQRRMDGTWLSPWSRAAAGSFTSASWTIPSLPPSRLRST